MGMTHSTIRRSGCIVSSYQRRFPVVYLLGGQCEGLELRISNSRSALFVCMYHSNSSHWAYWTHSTYQTNLTNNKQQY